MKDYRYLLGYLDRGLDYVLNFSVVYFCYQLSLLIYNPQWSADRTKLLLLAGSICLVVSFLYSFNNLYAPMRTQTFSFYIGRIFFVNLQVIVVGCAIVLLLSDDAYPFYTTLLILSALCSLLVLSCKKITMMSVLHSMRSNQKNIKHILVVTDSQEMVDVYMEEILQNPQFGYSIIGYVGNLNVIGLPHLGTTADLDRVLKEYRPDEVVMAFDTVRKKLITKYISVCNDNCSKIYVIPAICGYFKSPRQVSSLGNLPMVDIRSVPLDNPTKRLAKRLLDIVGSSILIVLTSPLMLFTAIGVRLSSPGPILFRQTRVGKNNEEFTIYKFRSMRINDEEQTGWSTDNDSRKTRFGAFIRKFALDELPQFFNVLKGDMSLVGPRPEVPYYVEKFRKEVPLYMLKHTLRPGITGLAQIKGLRGDTSIQARIDEDINYIENWTFWGDIKILLLTPLHAVNRHEKYAKREQDDALREQKEERSGVRQSRVEAEVTEGKKEVPKQRKKVLYVASTSSHLEQFHEPYIRELSKDEDVFTMACGVGVNFSISFDKHILSFHNLRLIRHIRKIIRREQFDRIILNTSLAAFLVRAAVLGMSNRPYVLNVVHGYLFPYHCHGLKNRFLLLCEQLMRRKTDAIAVMNREDDRIARDYHLTKGKIRFMYGMGVTLEKGFPVRDLTVRREVFGDEDGFVCTFAGELSTRKNQDFLIRAVERLRREGIPMRLMLLGEGGMHDKLCRLIEELGLEEHVRLLGKQNVLPYLQSTDLYLTASLSEGLPFNLMEAMSCGLPTLASAVKGHRDLLDETDGHLYSSGNMDSFCQAVHEIYEQGRLGVGTVSYPNLERYRLSSVFRDNMKIFTLES